MMSIYIILVLIAIPLCAVEVATKDDKHVKAWFTGGVFVMMAVPISLWGILQHIINYTQPHLQKYIIRIMWMVPIYALNAWFALRFKRAAIYLDTVRECYEAYVIYNFMAYLLSYLWNIHPQLHLDLRKQPHQKHIIPFCCLPPWRMGNHIIQNCKHGVLQYTILRPITTLIALICEICGVYEEGEISANSAWIYLTFINNISQIWAMYCLVLFYKATKDMLAPIKPIPKFLCVKFVVFFSFWQAVVIAILNVLGLLPATQFYDFQTKEMAAALQDFCICIEMFFAAIAHYFSFSHKPFIDQSAQTGGNCCQSFLSMLDVSDVKDDVLEHVKVIGTTMKKTVSGPLLGRTTDTETTPLLQSSDSHAQDALVMVKQMTSAEVHHTGGYQADTMSTSDWDVTSVDRYQSGAQPDSNYGRSITSSMHNFLDMSTSMEEQQTLPNINEHLNDHDQVAQKLEAPAKDPTADAANIKEGKMSNNSYVTKEKALIDFGEDDEGKSDDASARNNTREPVKIIQETKKDSESSSSEGSETSSSDEEGSHQSTPVIKEIAKGDNPVC